MFIRIKKLATKKVLIPLIVFEILLLIAGIAIRIIDVGDITDKDAVLAIRLVDLFAIILKLIPIIFLLSSVILLNSSKKDTLFKISLITGVIISICLPLFNKISYFINGAEWYLFSDYPGVGGIIISTLMMYVPTIFVIFDCFQKHKYITASCWVSTGMLAVQVFAALNMIINGFYFPMLFFAFHAVLHWAIMLIYLAQYVTKNGVKKKTPPVSIEEQIQTLKQKYERGEITQEEYREQKTELLKKL